MRRVAEVDVTLIRVGLVSGFGSRTILPVDNQSGQGQWKQSLMSGEIDGGAGVPDNRISAQVSFDVGTRPTTMEICDVKLT